MQSRRLLCHYLTVTHFSIKQINANPDYLANICKHVLCWLILQAIGFTFDVRTTKVLSLQYKTRLTLGDIGAQSGCQLQAIARSACLLFLKKTILIIQSLI